MPAVDLPDIVHGVEQGPLRVEELYEARELMLLAGDSHPRLPSDSSEGGNG